MKKLFLSIAVMIAAISAKAQVITLQTTGVATSWGSPNGGDTVNLTPCVAGQYTAGAAWSKEKVNFEKCFTIKFKAMFDVVLGSGGDGICVVFGSHITPATEPNGFGGYLGYYNEHGGTPDNDYKKSIAVEIDNYNDCGDPFLHDCPITRGDHTTMTKDAHALPLLPPVQTDPSSSSIKDGLFHEYKVTWVPDGTGSGTLTFYREGSLRWSNYYTYAGHLLHPNSIVWGFTGGYALSCSHQEITDVRLSKDCEADSSGCDDKCYWRLVGNNTTASDFIGTINDRDFKIRTNNSQWAVIDKVGATGIHITAPSTTLDVEGSAAYSTPSGVRLRDLPVGKGHELVIDDNGYVFVKTPFKNNATDTVVIYDTLTTRTLTAANNALQNQIDDLKQQLSSIQSQLNGGTSATGNSLFVTPNPTSGQVTAQYTIAGVYENALLKISDVSSGKTILSNPVSGNSGSEHLIMPANLASGQYTISLVIDGNVSITQKLILINR